MEVPFTRSLLSRKAKHTPNSFRLLVRWDLYYEAAPCLFNNIGIKIPQLSLNLSSMLLKRGLWLRARMFEMRRSSLVNYQLAGFQAAQSTVLDLTRFCTTSSKRVQNSCSRRISSHPQPSFIFDIFSSFLLSFIFPDDLSIPWLEMCEPFPT